MRSRHNINYRRWACWAVIRRRQQVHGCTGEHFAVTAAAAFSRLARLLAIWLVGAFYTRRRPREAQPYANRRRKAACLTPRSIAVMEFERENRVYVMTFRWRRTCSSAPPIQLIIQPAPNPLNALGFLSAQPSKSRRSHPAPYIHQGTGRQKAHSVPICPLESALWHLPRWMISSYQCGAVI